MNYLDLFIRVSFLIFIALLGFISGRLIKSDEKVISKLLIYIISPFVMFSVVLEAPEEKNYYFYTLIAFIFCSIMASIAFLFSSKIWKNKASNLFAFAGGTGNTGYFGLPIVLSIFDSDGVAIAVFIILGVNLYEFSYGYYITSLGNFSIKDSFNKVLKMPIIYAFLIATLLKLADLNIHESIKESFNYFKGSYSLLGMMVIGVTLSKINNFKFDMKFMILCITWKHLIWPLFSIIICLLLGNNINSTEKMIIILMSCVPMAGNVVVISNDLDVEPEKASTTVMLSTILAVFSLPITFLFLGL